MRLYSKIRQGTFEFKEEEWKLISKEAKDFVFKLLCVEPSKRLTVEEAVKDAWFNKNLDGSSALPAVRTNLSKFEE